MICFLDTSESLKAVLAGAIATTNPNYQAHWSDDFTEAEPTGALNGASDVTLVAVAAGEAKRTVDRLQVYNADTAAVTMTISKVNAAGTSYPILKVTVPVGGLFRWTEEGVRVTDSSGQLLQSVADSTGVGVAGTGVVATETGNVVRKTVLSLTDVPVTVGNTTGISFGGSKIYDFPAGRILLLGATINGITFDLTSEDNVTPIATTHGGDVSIGTTAPTDGTLTGTDVDIIPSTSIDPISAGITGAALAASAQFDGTSTAKDAFLNILIDDSDVADGASDVILVSGTVTLHWMNLGDY